MSEEKDDLKSIKVYKFDNTKENWHEFALKFRVIADTRDYRGIIDGSVIPPDKMADITITAEDTGAVLKEKKDKLKARKANKIGYRDLRHFVYHCAECCFRRIAEWRLEKGLGKA